MNKKIFVLPMIALFLVGCGNSTNNSMTPDSSGGDSSPTSSEGDPNEKFVDIHYFRDDGNYNSWGLWLWDYPSGSGAEYAFNDTDSYGAVAHYSITKNWANATKLGLIVKSKGSWNSKDGVDTDRTIDLDESLFKENTRAVYLISGISTVYEDMETAEANKARILSVDFATQRQIAVSTSANVTSYKVYEDKVVIKEATLETPAKSFNITIDSDASLDKEYELEVTFEGGKVAKKDISVSSLYKTEDFINNYTYDGELGAIYSPSSTTFKVWSPVSSAITLRTYASPSKTLGDNNHHDYPMEKGEKGVFSYTLEGDKHGLYYTYVVTNSRNKEVEVVDPYAKSTGYNGERGMVVDFSRLNPEGWDDVQVHDYDRKELTIYETHVADVTSSSTWGGTKANAKKYKGMYETGTTYTENGVTVKTGFDHIKELGVNAVQLLPIFDQKNDEAASRFNWGYNPENYNALEGAYASDLGEAGINKIKEFKQLVMEYNKAGINIIMDVVYNHVNSSDDSNFNVLMPGYYFRYTAAGMNSGGSGCGNETASEMPMMRKFMIDSTEFWAKEYKLGGFRFDLMGCHDIETMNQIAANLKAKTFENIYICGEPWTGGTSELKEGFPANQDNMSKYEGYGAFNDKMRDGLIKGGLSSKTDTGFVTNNTNKVSAGDMTAITSGLQGIVAATKTTNDPDKVTNYVTCHDNYTLYDRIVATGKNYDAATIKKMATLANALVFTSQGTSFMLAGEEFLRTKDGDNNSHASSYKVNELNYALKVANLDTFANYQKLIELKQDFAGLHYGKDKNTSYEINVDEGNACISYSITEGGRTYQFIHVNGLGSGKTFNLQGYTLVLDTLGDKTLSATTGVRPYETLIAYKAA